MTDVVTYVGFLASLLVCHTCGVEDGALTLIQLFAKQVGTDFKSEFVSQIEAERKPKFIYSAVRYMPSQNLVTCACPKCGSTSLFDLIYEQTFSKQWDMESCKASPQNIASKCWHGLIQDQEQLTYDRFFHSFAFAVIRDPIERLVSSWKSKYACDDDRYGQDLDEKDHKARRVEELLRLSGEVGNASCLALKDFASALLEVKHRGLQEDLNPHIMPQQDFCFSFYPPSAWSQIVVLSERNTFRSLAQYLGNADNDNVNSHEHASEANVEIDKLTSLKLASVTEDEYVFLAKYLKTESS